MLVIRLSRTGRRNQPKYRLVVAEHTAPIKGKVVEILGHYEPTSDKKFVFDKEKVETYIKNGAKPSNTVAKILNNNGFDLQVHVRPERKPKKAVEATTPKPADSGGQELEAPAAPGAEQSDGQEAEAAPAEGGTEGETPAEAPAEEVKEEVPVEEKPAEEAPAASGPEGSPARGEEATTEEKSEE